MNFLLEILTNFFDLLHNGVQLVFAEPSLSWGMTIILFTIIVKLLLLPLTIKQFRATSKMTELQPKMKQIQDKYKNDPNRAQQEMMKLYKEYNVSPFSGCLPLLIQFPILIALFNVFNMLDLSGIGFSLLPWITDLSAPDPLKILPILSALTTFLSTKLMQPSTGEAAAQTNTMNIVMTVMILVMSFNFSSALVLYWTVSNVFQLVQSLVMNKIKAKNAIYDAPIKDVQKGKRPNKA